ncbi:MAG: hypothetical protein EBT15_10280 [Betaproteobacteria bacterium]|nr:hypothetical protein [Betaproteobacteria bacterium]NDD13122.1 hypothetical protein [Betaproteobacteria bacterium]
MLKERGQFAPITMKWVSGATHTTRLYVESWRYENGERDFSFVIPRPASAPGAVQDAQYAVELESRQRAESARAAEESKANTATTLYILDSFLQGYSGRSGGRALRCDHYGTYSECK